MQNSIELLGPVALLAFFTTGGYALLWLMLKRPAQWEKWLTSYSDFFVRCGLGTTMLSEQDSQVCNKIIALLVALICLLGTVALFLAGFVCLRLWQT